MANPLKALNDWVRGADLQVSPARQEEKAFTVTGYSPNDYTPLQLLLVHGAGADTDARWQSDGNSAVFACLMALCAAYIEPKIKVWREDTTGQREVVRRHPLQTLMDDPHPHLTADEVWWWTTWARHIDGNAYLLKVRSGNDLTGNVVQLQPVSPTLMRPYTERDSANWIDAYRYNYAPGKWTDIDPVNVIHFRLGIDDQDMRLGLSPLRRLLREVSTDQEATRFSEALLKNFAIPGLIIKTPTDAATMTRDQAEDLSDRVASRFGGGNRGKVSVLAGGADIQMIGFSPEQLQLDALHHLPESRICAVMGVPPIMANLQIGLEQSANYASMKQTAENFTERKLVPQWRLDDAVIQKHLMPDFDSSGSVFVERDLADVRSLQEDEDAKYKRLTEAVLAGWVLPDEARSEIGLPPLGEVAPPPAEGDEPVPLAEAASRRLMELKQLGVDDYPALFDAMLAMAQVGLEADLDEYFKQQRRAIMRRVLEAG